MGDLLVLRDIVDNSRRRVKLGDFVRTTEKYDFCGRLLFPIGTICQVANINSKSDHLGYCLRTSDNFYLYDLGQFEFVKEGKSTRSFSFSTNETEGGFYEY